MGRALINVPKTARKGEIVEIRALVSHPMETGYRPTGDGRSHPRDIINRFVVTWNGEEIFSADLFPAMSANPYFAFSAVATESGTVAFRWIDDRGGAQVETAQIAVT